MCMLNRDVVYTKRVEPFAIASSERCMLIVISA